MKKIMAVAMMAGLFMMAGSAVANASETKAASPSNTEVATETMTESQSQTITHSDVVLAHSSDRYSQVLRANERYYIYLSGDGDTDLDLYVYDENGNLVDSDYDSTDECLCIVTPRWTGRFTIKVVNRGSVYNRYTIRII